MFITTIATLFATVAAQTQHVVNVGQGGLVYSPASLTAAVGDYVTFEFNSANIPHNAGRSTFDSPCAPAEENTFFSSTLQGGMNFTIMVNNTEPIWYYCGVAQHCLSGMVGVINPPSDETAESFATAARSQSSVMTYPQSSAFGGVLNQAVPAAAAASGSASSARASGTGTVAAAGGSGARATSGTSTSSTAGATGATTSNSPSTGFDVLRGESWMWLATFAGVVFSALFI